MAFNKKTVRDIKLTGRRVLLRADFNVPIINHEVTDDYRLRAVLPTIDYILKQKPKSLTIISHLGRPNGRDSKLSLLPVARSLSKLLGKDVFFCR